MRGIICLFFLTFLAGNLQAAENFLDAAELASLEPHPTIDGLSRHITPGVDVGAYTKLIAGGVTFYFSEKSKNKDMDADELKQISDSMKSAMATAAAAEAELVLEAGPGAALINVAITEINVQNKKRGLLGYTPVGFVIKSAGNLAGLRLQLKDAHIEGELVDSVTGNVVSIFRIEEIGEFDEKKGMSFEDLRLTFESVLAKGIAASRM
jgi:hypothetical protein